MGILKRIFHPFSSKRDSTELNTTGSLVFGERSGYSQTQCMRLSAVYRCVEVISNSVAQLPFHIYAIDNDGYRRLGTKHSAYRLINTEPSTRMSRYAFWDSMVSSMLLRGNAFAYIIRDNNAVVTSIEFLSPSLVTIIDDENGHIQAYAHPKYGWIEPCNMIHIANCTYDGEHGLSTLDFAMQTAKLSMDSEKHAEGFFRGGANLSGIVSINRALTPKQKKDFLESWYSTFDPVTGRPNGVAIMEADMDFKPTTVDPAAAQLLETRRYQTEEICRFFGVSPVKAYDLTKASYSSIEATQLAFLTDTIQPLLSKIELEVGRKLFTSSERDKYIVHFDTSSLIRTDKEALSNYYTKMYQLGVLTANDIRKQLDMQPIEGGDVAFVQSNLVPITSPLSPAQAQQQPKGASNSNNQQQNDPSSQGGEQ